MKPGSNVVFRVDASMDIGNGHLMRCLTLAAALRERSVQCSFICRAHAGHLGAHVRAQGFQLHLLPAATGAQAASVVGYEGWLGATQDEDARLSREQLGATRPDWIVVDHYSLDEAWERELRPVCRRILAIDDLGNRKHDCDLLLDQNLGSDEAKYAGLVPAACQILAGTRYTLLRKEFAGQRAASLSRRGRGQLRSILVSLGGVDKDNVTGRVLSVLSACDLPPDASITVVLGPHAPALSSVRALAGELPWPTRVLVDVADMAELMAESDLAVGAAGSSAWERCCLGLPTLMLVLADNQESSAAALENSGAAWLIGGPEVVESRLRDGLEYASDPARLRGMQLAAADLVDGVGAARVVKEMDHAGA